LQVDRGKEELTGTSLNGIFSDFRTPDYGIQTARKPLLMKANGVPKKNGIAISSRLFALAYF